MCSPRIISHPLNSDANKRSLFTWFPGPTQEGQLVFYYFLVCILPAFPLYLIHLFIHSDLLSLIFLFLFVFGILSAASWWMSIWVINCFSFFILIQYWPSEGPSSIFSAVLQYLISPILIQQEANINSQVFSSFLTSALPRCCCSHFIVIMEVDPEHWVRMQGGICLTCLSSPSVTVDCTGPHFHS